MICSTFLPLSAAADTYSPMKVFGFVKEPEGKKEWVGKKNGEKKAFSISSRLFNRVVFSRLVE